MASLEYDPEASAIYIRIKKSKIVRSEPISDVLIVDLDEKGKLVGIEILLPRDMPSDIRKKLMESISITH